jgi:hypothetical protein
MRKKFSRVFTGREIYEWGLLAEETWRSEGVAEEDIRLTRLNGMDGRDIRTLRSFTAWRGLLIVIRCPKPAARAFHRLLPAKPGHLHTLEKEPGKPPKAARDGIVRVAQHFTREDGTPARREAFVSDYDMMSIYRRVATGLEKIWVSPDPVEAPPPENPRKQWRGAFSKLARELIRELNGNGMLVSRLQHGCQDHWISKNNPGVGVSSDHFTAFNAGDVRYLPRPKDCGENYRQYKLTWSYDADGKFIMPTGG